MGTGGDRWGQGSVLSSLRDAKGSSVSRSSVFSLPEPGRACVCDFAERCVAQTHCFPNLLDLKLTFHRIPHGAHFEKHSLKGENTEAKEKEGTGPSLPAC